MKKTLKKNNVGFVQTDKSFFVQDMVAKKKIQFLDQLYGSMSEKDNVNSEKNVKKSLKLNFSSFLTKI
jgi:ABC-type Na+ transport system ATPase subunit NatA